MHVCITHSRRLTYPGQGNGNAEQTEYYRKRCLPTQEEVVERLHQVRSDYDALALEMRIASNESMPLTAGPGTPLPIYRLRRVFVLTNASPNWLDGLKSKLKDDGWEDVILSGNLVMDTEQRGVDVAVDMSVAEKAEVFVGNGVGDKICFIKHNSPNDD
jgi:hypothetical protein